MPRGNIASLEIEPMAVSATTTTTNGSRHAEQQTHNQQQQRPVFSSFRYRVKQLIMLIKLYTQIYPMITSCIAAIGVAMLFFSLLLNFRKPVTRNKLYHDYSKLDLKHNVEAANIDHWCLWGGDEQCTCDDFTEPTPRTATVKGWLDVHDANVASIDIAINYDVVFYGDELVEGWKGHHLGSTMSNLPVGESNATRDYFMEHFSRESGGAFDGVALGIMGDVVRFYGCYVL